MFPSLNRPLLPGAVFLLCLLLNSGASAQTTPVPDLLHIPGPLTVAGKTFQLARAVHPQPGYYKQEYIPAGDSLQRYHSMLVVEFIRGKTEIALLVADMIGELKKRQEANPNVRYEVLQKGGEYILDFLLTENAPSGIIMAERNIYRYRLSDDGAGTKGIQLFGLSLRAYDAGIPLFFSELKAGRELLLGDIAGADIPRLTL